MKKIVFLLLTTLGMVSIHAQDDSYIVNEEIRSPQVADMMRFDNVGGLSKISGRLDLNIELVRIRDRDFDFPVSLSYNSAGFIPSKPESYVGLNWSLNAGGAIVREVKGAPDDLQHPTTVHRLWGYSSFTKYGFNYFTNNNGVFNKDVGLKYVLAGGLVGAPLFLENKYINDNNLNFKGVSKEDVYIEASSDIYHFNFGPHSGKFMINFDGSVSVVSNNGGKYKVDLSRYNYTKYDGSLNSVIRIITDDGYIYSFGGSFNNVEYSHLWSNPFGRDATTKSGILLKTNAPEETPAHISSYHLYKIEAPNGRILNIEYATAHPYIHTWTQFSSNSLSSYLRNARMHNEYPMIFNQHRQNFICSWHPKYNKKYVIGGGGDLLIEDYSHIHNLTKIALVQRIYTDSQEILFQYGDSQYSPLDNLQDLDIKFEKQAGAELKRVTLNSIKENNDSKAIVTANFSYSKWSGLTGARRLLSSLQLSSVGKYSFEYDTSEHLPSPVTYNIDFWNYWRGHSHGRADNDSYQQLIPDYYNIDKELFYGRYKNGSYSEDRITSRSPGEYGLELGMLKQIHFPTGGSMEIEYESHEYSKQIKKTAASFFKPVLVSNNVIGRKAGGLRVSKIRRNNNVTTYLYKNSIHDNSSSGILINEPMLVSIEDAKSPDYNHFYSVFRTDNSGFDTRSYEEDHVRYSSVIEVPTDLDKSYEVLVSGVVNSVGETQKKLGPLTISNPTDQLWTLDGYDYRGAPGALYITNTRNKIIKEYHFTSDSSPKFKKKTPEELGIPAGVYWIYLESESKYIGPEWGELRGGVSFEAISLKPKSYSGCTPDGYTIEKFIDWEEEKDEYTHYVSSIISDFYLTNDYYNNFLHPIDKSYRRGKPKSVEVYNSRDKIVREEKFDYCNPPIVLETAYYYNEFGRDGIFVETAQSREPHYEEITTAVQRVPVELAYRPLEAKRTTEYFYDALGNISNQVTMNESYQYNYSNDFAYLKRKGMSHSDGSFSDEHYTYSYELSESPYSWMKAHNIWNTIVRYDVTKNDTPLFAKKNNYTLKEVPESQYNMDAKVFPVLDSQNLILGNIEETRTRFLQYDVFGNKVHAVLGDDVSGSHVFYLWSYKGRYPIAEVLGCSNYNEFKTAVETSFDMRIEEIPHLFDISQTPLENLRNHKLLKAAHVTTMRYEPSVGIKELTDPSGKTVYFEYDSSNRLSSILKIENGEKVIVNNYEYKLMYE